MKPIGAFTKIASFLLTATLIVTPALAGVNLLPYDPAGHSQALTLTAKGGGAYVGTWAVANLGNATAGRFEIGFWVDGRRVLFATVSQLAPRYYVWGNDAPLQLSPGQHTLELRANDTNSVGEDTLADNIYRMSIVVPSDGGGSSGGSGVQTNTNLVRAYEGSTGSTRVVPSGETVWISAEPRMPMISAQNVASGVNPSSTQWNWVSSFQSHSPSARLFPVLGDYDSVSYGQWWNPWSRFYSGDFFGGAVTIKGGNNISGFAAPVSLNIRGLNPKDAVVEAYARGIGMPWYGTAILKHETRSGNYVYNQFRPTGTNRGNPIFGAPHGWGMGQLDRGDDNKITAAEMWNWQKNLDSARSVIAVKTRYAQDYFDKVKATFPTKWEEPPFYTPPGASTRLTALEAASIQLYNGAAVVRKFGNTYYLSCWAFDENASSGQRWSFRGNPNNPTYVAIVVKEYEGRLATSDE